MALSSRAQRSIVRRLVTPGLSPGVFTPILCHHRVPSTSSHSSIPQLWLAQFFHTISPPPTDSLQKSASEDEIQKEYNAASLENPNLPNYDPTDPRFRIQRPPLDEPVAPDHPRDSDGRPVGLLIPDWDVELPAGSFGGYAKDFKAWADPIDYPPTDYKKTVQYDHSELVTKNHPPCTEFDLANWLTGVLVVLAALSVLLTKVEIKNYYKQYGEYYRTGWPFFHYEAALDIVPLVRKGPDENPESIRVVTVELDQLSHEAEEA